MESITQCRVCGKGAIKSFFDLGQQPLANSLPQRVDEKENFYPLSLSWCANCNLVQLNETIDPRELFSTYVWVTGTSKGAKEFADKFYDELTIRTPDPKKGYVLEIASNDGTFLQPFLKNGHDVLGIDPAKNVVEMALKAGVPTKCAFWGREEAEKIVAERGPAKIIFARNVMAHVADAGDFVGGLNLALSDDGVVAIEPHYARNILEGLQYDSIYHEHLCYFTLKSLEYLLSSAGLFIFDVAASPISGGAIIVYARKRQMANSKELMAWRERELENKTNEFASWENFAKRCFEHKKKLLALLGAHGGSGKVVGWGASARSSTLLNFCGIDSATVSSIIDLNPLKQGKFTAGNHIPIVAPEVALASDPSLVFVTGWNFAGEIIDMLRNKYGFRGPCLVPLPNEPRIVTGDMRQEI